MFNSRNKRKFQGRREKPEFDQKLLDLARVTRVVKGGRRFSFRATVVIGNKKGKVGVGVGKGSDVSDAVSKAVAGAKKNMIIAKRTNTTIAHEVREKFGSAKVLIKPAKEGKGIVAGGAMRAVVELSGIKDITAKSFGTSNKINVAKATILALSKLEVRKQTAITKKKEEEAQGKAKEESEQPKKENKEPARQN